MTAPNVEASAPRDHHGRIELGLIETGASYWVVDVETGVSLADAVLELLTENEQLRAELGRTR